MNGSHRVWIEQNVLGRGNGECLIWPFGRDRKGYARIHSKTLAHRYVCEKKNGPPPTPKHHAAHTCGKGHEGCVAEDHLVWKTPSENEQDKKRHGTDNRGERHPMSSLTLQDAWTIKFAPKDIRNVWLLQTYQISNASVSRIRNGVDWDWLEETRKGIDRQEAEDVWNALRLLYLG